MSRSASLLLLNGNTSTSSDPNSDFATFVCNSYPLRTMLPPNWNAELFLTWSSKVTRIIQVRRALTHARADAVRLHNSLRQFNSGLLQFHTPLITSHASPIPPLDLTSVTSSAHSHPLEAADLKESYFLSRYFSTRWATSVTYCTALCLPLLVQRGRRLQATGSRENQTATAMTYFGINCCKTVFLWKWNVFSLELTVPGLLGHFMKHKIQVNLQKTSGFHGFVFSLMSEFLFFFKLCRNTILKLLPATSKH